MTGISNIEIEGTPTIQGTGSIKLTIAYAVPYQQGSEDEEVTLNFNSSLSSLCVLPKEGNSFVFLVSPMRLSDNK